MKNCLLCAGWNEWVRRPRVGPKRMGNGDAGGQQGQDRRGTEPWYGKVKFSESSESSEFSESAESSWPSESSESSESSGILAEALG